MDPKTVFHIRHSSQITRFSGHKMGKIPPHVFLTLDPSNSLLFSINSKQIITEHGIIWYELRFVVGYRSEYTIDSKGGTITTTYPMFRKTFSLEKSTEKVSRLQHIPRDQIFTCFFSDGTRSKGNIYESLKDIGPFVEDLTVDEIPEKAIVDIILHSFAANI
jgi:hypothetical protein